MKKVSFRGVLIHSNAMSERYANCCSSADLGCPFCGGTGFSGDAMEMANAQFQYEWERDFKAYAEGKSFGFNGSWKAYLSAEDEFYSNPKPTLAMDKAVAALHIAIEKQRERERKRCSLTQVVTVESIQKTL